MRIKRGNVCRNRHKKILKLAKGFKGARSRIFKVANIAVMKALKYAYRDRRATKRNMRRLWIVRINAAVREQGMSYSRFVNACKKANIQVNRKMLADLAVNDKEAFKDAVIKALKKEKVEAQLINRTSNPLIAIVNPTKDNEYTISVLNKTDGTILMEETKVVTKKKNNDEAIYKFLHGTIADLHDGMLLKDMDKAIEKAYQFYLEHPNETLIVVTADHETGGIALGDKYNVNWEVFEKSWNENGQSNNLDGAANAELNKAGLIGWTTGDHTGGAVPVYAIGKGAEKFGGRFDNTDIKNKILGR